MFDKYAAIAEKLSLPGPEHEWSSDDAWTEEQQADFWAKVDARLVLEAQKIVNYVDSIILMAMVRRTALLHLKNSGPAKA